MRKYIEYGLIVSCLAAGCVLLSCNSSDRKGMVRVSSETAAWNDSLIAEAKRMIRSGDLVLRAGTDFSSEQVKGMSHTDKTYSHGGIAVREFNRVYIYHVEPDFENILNKVRKEPVDSFLNPLHNSGFALARYDLTDPEKESFLSYLDTQYRRKIPFDMGFELGTDDSLYCSEMISKGLARSTGNRIVIGTDRLNDRSKYKLIKQYFKLNEYQFANRIIIPIDRLFLNPHCQILKKYPFRP